MLVINFNQHFLWSKSMYKYIYRRFPIFDLNITIKEDYIIGLEFLKKDPTLVMEGLINNKLVDKINDQLDCYLKDSKFKFNLPMYINGTLHQEKVWEQMLLINPGSVMSYKDIAQKIKSSPRAVGNACGRNKIALIIPCHRVISTSGRLGGFMKSATGYTIEIKSWLLKHEGVILN